MRHKRIWLGMWLAMALTQAGGLSAEDREWTVAKHLQVSGQPFSIKDMKDASESYRFILTDAGLTSSTIVLITLKDNQPLLKAASVDMHTYYDSKGKEGVERVERKLTRDEWAAFKQKFTAANFWKAEAPKRLVLDGTNWTLEANAFGRQRSVTLVAADEGEFRAACLEAWRLSGMFMGMWDDKKR